MKTSPRLLAAISAPALAVAGVLLGFLAAPAPAGFGATPTIIPKDGDQWPYLAVPAFGGVEFKQPVQVVYAPGETKRAFVVEFSGTIAVVNDVDHPKREVFLDLNSPASRRSGHGPLTMAFHPKFAENGLFYVWFSPLINGVRTNRLARFHLSARNPAVADLASETPLISQPTGRGGHDGGTLLFGPDGYLYLSLGDGDEHERAAIVAHQHIDRSFFGVILRIDVDQKPGSLAPNPSPAVHPGTYAIPPDNPFVGATSFNGQPVNPKTVHTEIWAIGMRNPWRMAFDTATGKLWCGDVGLHLREEIDLIVRGGNYGWDFREGIIPGPSGPPPTAARFIEPIWDYDHNEGISITGGFVYHGKNLPGLEGKYLFADYGFGKVWALDPDGDKSVTKSHVRQIASAPLTVGFTADPATGDPLLVSYGGQILRLVPNPEKK
jgi:glucose/arabinose dehydrogenase